MTFDPKLQKLLASLPPPEQMSFLRLADALSQAKFTGSTTVHWLNGVPKQLDLGSPVRLSIVEGVDTSGGSDPG